MNRTGKHIDLIIIHIEAKLSVKIRLTSIIYQINHALSRSFATTCTYTCTCSGQTIGAFRTDESLFNFFEILLLADHPTSQKI